MARAYPLRKKQKRRPFGYYNAYMSETPRIQTPLTRSAPAPRPAPLRILAPTPPAPTPTVKTKQPFLKRGQGLIKKGNANIGGKGGIMDKMMTRSEARAIRKHVLSPEHSEHWYLSDAAYGNGDSQLANLGYTELKETQNDLTMKAYYKGHGHIVFAHKGTNPFSPKDIKTDAKVWGPFGSEKRFVNDSRVKYDMAKMQDIMEHHDGFTFATTGHSLGGTMAANAGLTYNIPYTAFNPGALNSGLKQYFAKLKDSAAKVHGRSSDDLAQNGSIYRFGKDTLSKHAESIYQGANHTAIESQQVYLKDHSLQNFKPHLHPDTYAMAEGISATDN